MPIDHDQTHAVQLQRFNQLKALILKRKAFEAAHPYPPYSLYQTDFNFTDVHGNSLLHYAAALGDMNKIRECLKDNINPDLKNNLAQQAIHLALNNHQLEAARALFMAEADCTEVHLTHCQDDPKQIAWFKEELQHALKGAFPLPSSNYQFPRYHGQWFKPAKKQGTSHQALIRAAEIGDIPFLQSVVTHHSLPQKTVNALLPVAAGSNQLDTVRYLIENASAMDEPYGKTALIEAVKNRHRRIIDYLLSKKVDLNRQDSSKNTALSYALANNDQPVTNQLLQHGATYLHTNLSGNTLMHVAVNVGCSFLKDLLFLPGFAALQHTRNIYGFTPLDLALQTRKDSFIQLLAPEWPSDPMKKRAAYGVKPVPVNQNPVLDKMVYRLKLNYRDTRYFNPNGHCNGFSFLHSLYADKEPYYSDTLALMSHWDGSEEALAKPFDSSMPQAAFYKNLGELFEQWTNDVIWFQHSRLEEVDRLRQDDRAEQFDIIKAPPEKDNQYVPLYVEPHHATDEQGRPIHYERNEAQFLEIMSYIARMPAKTHVEFIGVSHATSAYRKAKSLVYYDCNFIFQTENNLNAQALTRRLLDWTEEFEGKMPCRLIIFCFQKDFDSPHLPDFFVLNEKEVPKSKEEACQFQRHSANYFTPLHVAVITRSLPAVKRLLADGFCDIHARDCSGRSAIKMAMDSHFNEALLLFLTLPELRLDELSGFINQAYRHGKKDILDIVLAHPEARHLHGLLLHAIPKNDLAFVKHLLTQVKMNPNQITAYTLPLMEALQRGNFAIIQALLDEGADLFMTCGYTTPLKVAFQRQSTRVDQVIAYLKDDIHRRDAMGMTALHHAVECNHAEALCKLIHAGADVRQITAAGKTAFDLLSHSLSLDKELKACYRLLISHYQFDLSNASHHQILKQLLVKLAHTYDERLYQLLLRQCNPDMIDNLDIEGQAFLHHLIETGCVEPIPLLLEQHIRLDPLSPEGNTPLMALIQAGNITKNRALIERFIQLNADVTIKNNKGKTAVDLMLESGDEHLRQWVEDYELAGPPCQA
ncbi:ankyrin repeat domain-containing protein [Legionella erythra]|uniref:Ankyrin repeat protein n=1 Tax=Legionella erythra TaxID=448 RepID=A0A0W0TFH2_LEGER|nr:ankyrin repeat domain-containing protein [Legionella erythra]KTC94322.1 ankyrin repeat protein [Legionella erythra]